MKRVIFALKQNVVYFFLMLIVTIFNIDLNILLLLSLLLLYGS